MKRSTRCWSVVVFWIACLVPASGWSADREGGASHPKVSVRRSKGKTARRKKKRKASRRCGSWLQRFQKAGVLLSPKLRQMRIAGALAGSRVPPEIHRLARRYPRMLRAMEQERQCWRKAWARTKRYKSVAQQQRVRSRLLAQIARSTREALERAILPVWIGTPWDFYGTAVRPQQKSIACGYFVTHALRSVGFRFPETFVYRSSQRGPMRIYEVAKLPAAKVIELYASPREQVRLWGKSPRALAPHLQRLGRGIYVLALDTHIGLILHHGPGKTYFWHSSSHEDWSGVVRENLYTSKDVQASRVLMIGKVGTAAWKRWLEGRGFFARSVR